MRQLHYSRGIGIAIMLCCCNTLFCQQPDFTIRHFNSENGLSSRNVYCIEMDERGIIWAGTGNGINRFDGYEFTRISSADQSLVNDRFLQIDLTTAGKFWAQRDHNEFVLFHPQRGKILQSYPSQNPAEYKGILLDPIAINGSRYYQTEVGNIFVSTANGDGYTIKNLTIYPHQEVQTTPWGNLVIQDRLLGWTKEIDASGREIRQFNTPIGSRLSYYFKEKNYVLFYASRADDKEPVSDYIFELSPDTIPKKIELFREGRLVNFGDLNKDPNKAVCLTKDNLGYIWLSSQTLLWVFDPQGHFVADLYPDLYRHSSRDWSPNHIFVDATNRVWLSTGAGIFLVERKENSFTTFYGDENYLSTRGIRELPDKRLLTATYRGARILDPQTGKYEVISADINLVGLTQLVNDTIWGGSHGQRIYYYVDGADQLIETIGPNRPRMSNATTPYYDPANQRLYVGAYSNLFYSDDHGITWYPFLPSNPKNQSKLRAIKCFHKNSDGLWVGGGDGVFQITAEDSLRPIAHFANDAILYIYEDAAGIFWVGTEGTGLVRWDRKADEIKRYTVEDGLINNVIYTVYEVPAGVLWLPSDEGLMRFDKETEDVVYFLPDDGLSHEEFNTYSHCLTAEGRLFLGGLNGLIAFYPADIQPAPNPTKLVLTSLLQMNGKTGKMEERLLEYLDKPEIVMAPNNHSLTVEFALLDYAAAQKRYAWKIEGLQSSWNYQEENYIRLNGLPFGSYKLIVKGISNGKQWSESKLEIPIYVQPPPYLRKEFLSLLAILLGLFVFAYVQWRTYRLKYERKKLARLVAKGTAELTHRNQELKALNASKDRLFAIVSHDLRAPLIGLRGIAEKVNFLIEHNRWKDIKSIGPNIEQSVATTQRLLDNLLSWSILQGNQLPHQPEEVCLGQILDDVQQLYGDVARQKDITLAINPPSGIHVYADPNALAIVFRNLIDNAIKFTNPGGKVTVNILFNGEHSLIEVRDSGIGMGAKQVAEIFSLNDLQRQKGTKGEQGFGIGLVLCKELLHRDGGKITVQSNVGEGTTFRILLPLKRESHLVSYEMA